ncbi:MAG: tetratricopeptide repeat protein [Candidatus Hodarchaeales archaeon]
MPSRFVPKYFGRDKLSKADSEKLENLRNQTLKGLESIKKGNNKKGYKLAEQAFKEIKENEEFKKRPILINAIICQAYALLGFGKLNDCLKIVKEGENQLESIENIKKKDLAEKKSMLNELKAKLYRRKGNTTLANELFKQSLSTMERLKNKEGKAGLLNNIGIIHGLEGEHDYAIKNFQHSLEIFEELSIDHPKLKLFNNLGLIHAYKGELDQALEYYQKGLDLIEKFGDNHSKATLLLNISQTYQNRGNLKAALEKNQESLAIFKELDSKYEKGIALNSIGIIHELRGELYQAHEQYTKSFIIFKEIENNYKTAMSYNNIGNTYLDGGDVDKAIAHYKEGLKLLESYGNNLDLDTCITLYNLISVNVQRGSKENFKRYLHQIQEINDKTESKTIHQIYRLTKALVLKTSERVVKQAEAQQIFQEITEEDTIGYEYSIIAKKNLCELLIQELSTSGQEEILIEIKEILNELLTIAEKQESNSLLIETYILQSKMALLELNPDISRQLLRQARQLTEEKGSKRLAFVVSREYDSLLTQLGKWIDLTDREVSLAERLEIAELESMVTRLIRKRAEIAEISEEEPILFLVLARSGMSMFSKQFVSEQNILADQLIGGFITAINAFSQQAFSETGSIEGIKHKDYTILMNPTDPLLCCYIFKGPSYYALQKLQTFSDTIKVSDIIWDMMLEASSIGKDISGEKTIEDLVAKIFLASSDEESASEVFLGQKMNATINHGIFLDILSI